MDNATDALIMAGSVLLFVIALTVAMSSFTNLRAQVDEIVKTDDTIEMAKSEDGEYINFIKATDDVRTVKAETVISSIRRVPKESYVVYIYWDGVESDLYGSGDNVFTDTEQRDLFLTKSKITQEYQPKGESEATKIIDDKQVIEISLSKYSGLHVDEILNKDFYNIITGKDFKEYLGIYQNKTEAGVSSANKETYRIITFVEDKTSESTE